MLIRISIDELNEFDSNLKNIKSNINELAHVMDKIVNKIVVERIVTDLTVANDLESLATEINELENELGNYIFDINLIKEEFKAIDYKLKENSNELKNMIQDLLRKSKNSFIPATYSINSSISSGENEDALKVCGINEKINLTTELNQYNTF